MSYIKKPSRTNRREKKKVFNYSFSNIITKNSSKILTLYFDFVECKKFDFTVNFVKCKAMHVRLGEKNVSKFDFFVYKNKNILKKSIFKKEFVNIDVHDLPGASRGSSGSSLGVPSGGTRPTLQLWQAFCNFKRL